MKKVEKRYLTFRSFSKTQCFALMDKLLFGLSWYGTDVCVPQMRGIWTLVLKQKHFFRGFT